MKKLMLLVVLATLVSCGGKTGPVGTPGAAGTDGVTGPQGEAGPQGPAGDSSNSLDSFFSGNNYRAFGAFVYYEKYTYVNNDGSPYNDGLWDSVRTQNRGPEYALLYKKTVTMASTVEGIDSAPENKNLAIIALNSFSGAQNGATYEFVNKLNADGNWEVVKNEIPRRVNHKDEWFAVDFSAFEQLHPTSFSINDVANFIGSSTPLTQDYSSGRDGMFKDNSGNYYFDTAVETSKDLESMGSKIETAEVESVKADLQSFGLSVERTEKLSKLLNSYRKISNKRALSASEKDVFTKELLGMTFDQAAKKMVENYDGLIETAADKNGTSPEAVKELVNSFLTR